MDGLCTKNVYAYYHGELSGLLFFRFYLVYPVAQFTLKVVSAIEKILIHIDIESSFIINYLPFRGLHFETFNV